MTSGEQVLTAAEWATLSTCAGDVQALVAADGHVTWWSDDAHPAGLPLAGALVPEDARLLGAVLTDDVTGPHWLRLRDAQGHGRWMSVFAVPRGDGWIVQFRDVRTLGPAGGMPQHTGVLTDPEQLVHEVAWLLSATPRTGRETAVVTCELTDLPSVVQEQGRLASEEVVEVVVGRISDALRSGDLVARLDENRLLMVLRGVHDLRGAVEVLERLQEVIAEPIVLAESEVQQSLTAGVTLISRGESAESVLERSAGALDLAVHAGAGRVITSPPL